MRNMDDATRMMLMASTTPLGKSAEGGADISVPAGRQVIPHSARAANNLCTERAAGGSCQLILGTCQILQDNLLSRCPL